MLRHVIPLILLVSPAAAAETDTTPVPKAIHHQPPPMKPQSSDAAKAPVTFSAEEVKAMYELGVVQGSSQSALTQLQAKAKSAIDKLKLLAPSDASATKPQP